jgi:hypothetical protein
VGCDPDLKATGFDAPISISSKKAQDLIGELEVHFAALAWPKSHPLEASQFLLRSRAF